ncbi:MAG: LysE family transporter, partial [Hyphomicrobiales bacterium]|nr:LysE family transporter [Hyphomicrobiales bacterium]
ILPQLHDILKWLGSAYLLFLVWKIATAAQPKQGKREAKPLSFLQAALFQWINPKGWIMSVAALANYTTTDTSYLMQTLMVAWVFFLTSLGATTSWAYFGALIRRLLRSYLALRIFNTMMAALIVASIVLLYL